MERLDRQLADARSEIDRDREHQAELQQRIQALADGGRDARATVDRLNSFLENARAEAERQANARAAAESQFCELQEAARSAREEVKQRSDELIVAERKALEARENAEQELGRPRGDRADAGADAHRGREGACARRRPRPRTSCASASRSSARTSVR